jgi:hypothetical protein
MKKILSIVAVAVLTLGLLYNLQYALNGYSNDGIAFADPATTASPGFTGTPGDCSITVTGTVGSIVSVGIFSIKITGNGKGTLTVGGASNVCSNGGTQNQCTNMTCGQFWASM